MESGEEDNKTPPLADQRLASALTHPQRALIFAELNKHMASPGELAETVDKRLSTVSYHYRVLENLGGLGMTDRSEAVGDEDPDAS